MPGAHSARAHGLSERSPTLRLGRQLAELAPEEPEVHGLVALMEFQASRLRARVGAHGEAVRLPEQDRGRWDRLLIARGLAALRRARTRGGEQGPYKPVQIGRDDGPPANRPRSDAMP